MGFFTKKERKELVKDYKQKENLQYYKILDYNESEKLKTLARNQYNIGMNEKKELTHKLNVANDKILKLERQLEKVKNLGADAIK